MKHTFILILLGSLIACGGAAEDTVTDLNGNVTTIPNIEGNYHCVSNCIQDECFFSGDVEVTQVSGSFDVYAPDTGQTMAGTVHADNTLSFSGDNVVCAGTYNSGSVTATCSIDGIKCNSVKYTK